jgi:DNA-binding transcriptional regulator YiaG
MASNVRKPPSAKRGFRSVKKSAPPKPAPEQSSPVGSRLIAGMEGLLAAMKAGGLAEVGKKFTVRKVRLAKFEVPALGKADVVAIRSSLGVSQPVFASLLGVSPALVKGWEQGVKVPSGVALRFLAEVRRNPDYWKERVREAASGG